jgi:hypothetical protein
MDDIVFYTKTGVKSSNTYNGLFSINENGTYSLGRFSPLKPKIKENNLEFITGEVDPMILGINYSSQEIMQLWKDYEQQDFPLEDILQALYFRVNRISKIMVSSSCYFISRSSYITR